MSRAEENQGGTTNAAPARAELAPPDYCDPVIEAYKKDVDRTLLRENLKLTVEERFEKFERFMECVSELRAAGQRFRRVVVGVPGLADSDQDVHNRTGG